MVIVTHELASAFLVADRILMLDNGRVIATGTPEEIRANTNPRVRQFLNRQPDKIEQDDEEYLRLITGEE